MVLIREEVFTYNNKSSGMEPAKQLYNMTSVIMLPPLPHSIQSVSPGLTSAIMKLVKLFKCTGELGLVDSAGQGIFA